MTKTACQPADEEEELMFTVAGDLKNQPKFDVEGDVPLDRQLVPFEAELQLYPTPGTLRSRCRHSLSACMTSCLRDIWLFEEILEQRIAHVHQRITREGHNTKLYDELESLRRQLKLECGR